MSEDLEQSKNEGEDFVAPETGSRFYDNVYLEQFDNPQRVQMEQIRKKIEQLASGDEETKLMEIWGMYGLCGNPEKIEEFKKLIDYKVEHGIYSNPDDVEKPEE